MAQIQQQCPRCATWQSVKAKTCISCGYGVGKRGSERQFRVDYRDASGKRTREKIGPSLAAAEQRLREVLTTMAEGRHIHKSPDARTRFKDLAAWYLSLDKVKGKKSYSRDRQSVGKLCAFFGDRLLKDINPALVEKYLHRRLAEPSYRGHLTRPATVVRELACMNHIFTKAVSNRKAERNPVKGVARPPENNSRDRVLSREEYDRLIAECPPYVEPVIKLAFYTGMRRGEIMSLTWDRLDLKGGIIRLNPEDTKTQQGRDVPLCPELLEMFKAMPQGLPGVPVFTRKGKPITGSTIRVGLEIACRQAGIEDFTFHDLRHCFTTNMRRAGVHDLVIMAITGHKTMSMFQRYNSVSGEELRAAAEKIGNEWTLFGHSENLDTINEGLGKA